MKSILVPVGGGKADESVLATALAVARLFSAHLQFVHIRVRPGQAAVYSPGVEFVSGPALRNALDQLGKEADERSSAAAQRVHEFCERAMIRVVNAPTSSQGVTASWIEEDRDARQRLIFHSRHNDLVVMGRAKRPNGLPPDFLETLLMACGRPILLAASAAARCPAGTIMVCWRETPDAARAMVAATPLLTIAERVVFCAVDEGAEGTKDAVEDVARQFGRNGVPTDVEFVAANRRPVAEVLFSVAKTRSADMMVMGAYGHRPMHELIFGGCTRAVIQNADIPVFLMH